jgi:hypothetical protein
MSIWSRTLDAIPFFVARMTPMVTTQTLSRDHRFSASFYRVERLKKTVALCGGRGPRLITGREAGIFVL